MPNVVKPIIYIPPLPPIWQNFLAEFVGTFILVFVITQANDVYNTTRLASVSVSFTVVHLVFSLGHHRAGNMNPSMSFGLWMLNRMTMREMFFQISAQMIACMAAGLTSLAFFGGGGYPFCAPAENSPSGIAKAFVAEFIGTMMLMTVTHASAITRKGTQFFGLSVGATVMSMAIANGKWSGAAFNPAVTTALQLVKCIGGDCSHMKFMPMYFVAQFLGAMFSNTMFCLMTVTDVSSTSCCCNSNNDNNQEDQNEENGTATNKNKNTTSNLSSSSPNATSVLFVAGDNSKVLNR